MSIRLYVPGDKKASAEYRLEQIKEFERLYSRRKYAGNKRCKTKLMESFCKEIGVKWKTFYMYHQSYLKGGANALVPKWGWKKGRSFYKDAIPLIKEVYYPGRRYTETHKELASLCKERKISLPTYSTMIRIIAREGLNAVSVKRPELTKSIKKQAPVKRIKRDTTQQIKDYLKPDWIRITNNKAFNLAVYKYSLIMQILDPSISRDQKRMLINDASSKPHRVFPGEEFFISKATIYKYINDFKSYGLDGLIDKRSLLKTRRYDNIYKLKITLDLKKPIDILSEIYSKIESAPDFYPTQKHSALKILDYCIKVSKSNVPKYKKVDLGRKLTPEEIHELESYANSMHKMHRERAKMLLMANSGCAMMDIAFSTGRAHQTIYGWINQFKTKGINFIPIKHDCKKNRPELRNRTERIVKILHTQPKDYGFNRTSWRLADIAQLYMQKYGKKLSLTSIRRAIKQTNYTWKRARRVLISNDPNYREKTKKVFTALQNLGPKDAFFFIDEAGPWAVKKYGGKSLTPKNEIKIYPQIQKIRGRVTFIAALDAVSNQLVWLFTKSKNTAAVVALIKILFFKYRKHSKIIITWDCASWHKSHGVKACLEELSMTKGPEIIILPLPKRAQFLNVIESVFSGTKRAVIDNSNYENEREMKIAINRHFAERNQYFLHNPKRAGNKIWDKEIFNIDYFESGLHKHI